MPPTRIHPDFRRTTLAAALAFAVFGLAGVAPSGAASGGPPPEPDPLPPLGGTAAAGRVEMIGSGFELTLPDDWTVEVADPEPDVFSAASGEAWEALRAISPDGTMACSVSVGVATVSLRDRSGMASGGVTVGPTWDEEDDGTLIVPEPRLGIQGDGEFAMQMPSARLHRDDPDLDHDVMYAVSCSATGEDGFEALESAIEGIIETFGFLPEAT